MPSGSDLTSRGDDALAGEMPASANGQLYIAPPPSRRQRIGVQATQDRREAGPRVKASKGQEPGWLAITGSVTGSETKLVSGVSKRCVVMFE